VKRAFIWVSLIIGVASLVFFGFLPPYFESITNVVTGPQPPAVSARAAALHKTLQIADMHADTLLWKRAFNGRASRGQVDLPRLQQGNVALQILSSVTKTPKGQNYDANNDATDNITLLAVAQGQPVRTWGSLIERSLWHAEKLRRAMAASDGQLIPIRRWDAVELLVRKRNERAHGIIDRCTDNCLRPDAIGVLLSVEGLHNLEGKRANLDRLYEAGFRMAGLTHFFDNELAGSMHGLKKGGLTPFGIQIIRAMEAKGMVVDIAHCSHQCVADVLKMAKRPIVSSHGGVQATCKVNRNLTDDEIRGVAATGGVIGIGYWDAAVCNNSPAGVVKAIAHVRDLVGIDYVGLGSDFDGAVKTQFDTTRLDAITQALIDAEFSDADIAKVMGGNVLRLLAQTLPPK
jgi:membrane dipeptidase